MDNPRSRGAFEATLLIRFNDGHAFNVRPFNVAKSFPNGPASVCGVQTPTAYNFDVRFGKLILGGGAPGATG
jgi:hypothetical protein